MTALGSLDEFGILLLEDLEVPLGFPVPDAVGSKEQIHLLKSALIRFRVQGPYHGNGDNVGSREDVVGVFPESLEHNGAEKCKPAVSDGPANDTPCVTLGADLQGEDLGRVQPWDSEPGGAEGGSEQEDHGDGA